MSNKVVCSVCGSKNVYAKGRCRNCYERFRKNGNDLSRADRLRTRYMGQTQNGWQVVGIEQNERSCKLLVRCTACGETKAIFPNRFYRIGEHKGCVNLLALTKKQERFLHTFKGNHSITLTARALNVSKASASDMFNRMRRNYTERSK